MENLLCLLRVLHLRAEQSGFSQDVALGPIPMWDPAPDFPYFSA